jgi:hypothetical protein
LFEFWAGILPFCIATDGYPDRFEKLPSLAALYVSKLWFGMLLLPLNYL